MPKLEEIDYKIEQIKRELEQLKADEVTQPLWEPEGVNTTFVNMV